MLQHDPIQKLNAHLWRVEGEVPGMSIRRVMTVAKRSDGDLVIHSGILLSDSEFAELEAWGRPRYLLVPNRYHRLDAAAFRARYPDLIVLSPSGSRAAVEKVIPTQGAYEDFPPDSIVRVQTLPGTAGREGVILIQAADGTSLVFNDLVMNMDKWPDVMGNLITTLLGSAPGPRISRLSRWALVKDRGALSAELERLAALPDLCRIIVSHDKISEGNTSAASDLRQALAYL